MSLIEYEVKAAPWKAATEDSSDRRIVWVLADNEAQVKAALAGTRAEYRLMAEYILHPIDVSFVLPMDSDKLKQYVLNFEGEVKPTCDTPSNGQTSYGSRY